MRVVPLLAYLVLSSMAFAAAPPRPTLLDLAKTKFAPRELTHAEEKVFMSTELGEPASALTGDDKQDDPANAANWPDARVVHAECLAWLCTDREASSRVTFRGIQIYGMRIDGKLDLEFAQAPFPFWTWKCAFTNEIVLRHAHFPALYLQFTHVKSIDADGAKIDGNIFLRDHFKAGGEVRLLGATIGGNLECNGAQLTNPKGMALNADGAKINGSVFLRNGFSSQGEVNLLGATIGGNLECNHGAQLINPNPNGRALNADGVKINSYVFLRDGFKAQGEVNLLGAIIGRNLECDGAQLSNPDGKALNADGAKINGSAFLRNGFSSQGEVNFLGATIGLNLDCEAAQLSNPKGMALNADGAKINGGLYLRRGFKAIGEVDLIRAAIGGDLDCDGAELFNPDGYGLNADRSTIDGGVYLRSHFKADGGVGFFATQIKSQLNCYNTLPAEHTWFELRSAKIGTFRDEEKSWPGEGKLFLDGFTYDRISEDSPLTAQSRIEWLHRQPHHKFLPQPYEQLASVLRNMGHEREARRVMIQKNQDHANFTKRFSQEWWWYNVFGWLIGYGYAPSRAFFISLGMILLGWGLFRLGFIKNLILPADENGYEKDESGKFVRKDGERTISDDYPKFNALIFSLESFTPLLKLDQSSNWAPNAKCGAALHFWRVHLTTGSLLRVYLWFHILAGWVLTSLWVGALTGLVKT